MKLQSWLSLIVLSGLALPVPARAKVAGVIDKNWVWRASDTKTGTLVGGVIVLRACWDIPALTIPGGKSVSDWKLEVENHIKSYWNGYAGIKIQFESSNCDFKIGHDDRRYAADGKAWAPNATVGRDAVNAQNLGLPAVVFCWTYQNYSPGDIHSQEYSSSTGNTVLTYNPDYHRYSILAQAIHEFGHVLGLKHEQLHPDIPPTCKVEASNGEYTPIGLYDESSIMNYCNPDYLSGSQYTPSCGDIATIRAMYRLHPTEQKATGCVPECASGLTIDLAKTGESIAACKPYPQFVMGTKANLPSRKAYPDDVGTGGTGGTPVGGTKTYPVQFFPPPITSVTVSQGTTTDTWSIRTDLLNKDKVYGGSVSSYKVYGWDRSQNKDVTLIDEWANPYGGRKLPSTYSIPKGYGQKVSPSGLFYEVTKTQPKKVLVHTYEYVSIAMYWWECSPVLNGCFEIGTTSKVRLGPPFPRSFDYFNALGSATVIPAKEKVLVPGKYVPGGVNIRPFYMDKFEVTQKDYMAIMREFPFKRPGDVDFPAESMTLYDAILYCNKRSVIERLSPVYSYSSAEFDSEGNCTNLVGLTDDKRKNGYRLPTSQEWIHAFQAGATDAFAWGAANPSAYGWSRENSSLTTHSVGQKLPNPWGLHDMFGNVREWTWDGLVWDNYNYQCAHGTNFSDAAVTATEYPYNYSSCGSAGSRWPFIGFRPIRNYVSLGPIYNLLLN